MNFQGLLNSFSKRLIKSKEFFYCSYCKKLLSYMGKIYWKSLDDSQKSIWVKIINDSVGYKCYRSNKYAFCTSCMG